MSLPWSTTQGCPYVWLPLSINTIGWQPHPNYRLLGWGWLFPYMYISPYHLASAIEACEFSWPASA